MGVDDWNDALTTSICGRDRIGEVKIPVSEIDAAEGGEIVRPLMLTRTAFAAATRSQTTGFVRAAAATRSGSSEQDDIDEPEGEDGPSCEIAVRAWPAASRLWPPKKWVFLIRHGQSMWNQAEHTLDISEMVTHTDHGLSLEGVQQASDLAARIRGSIHAESCSEPQHVYQEFLAADRIYSSPLTRAVET